MAQPLANIWDEIVDSLPGDWSDIEIDLRIFDEEQYIDAAVFMTVCNAQPYSQHDWHWRILCANHFGHAAAASAVRTSLKLLDEAEIAGEIAVRKVTTGRVETVNTWGRPESWRQEFRRLRAQ
jgi:hypothetical protein